MGQSSVDRYFNVDQKKKKKDFPQMNRINHCRQNDLPILKYVCT